MKTLRNLTFAAFGIVVVFSIVAFFSTFFMARTGELETLSFILKIFAVIRTVLDLTLLILLIMNLVLLREFEEAYKVIRFVWISLIVMIISIIFKIISIFIVPFVLRYGMDLFNAFSTHVVIGIINGITSLLITITFLIGLILYLISYFLYGIKREAGEERI